MSFFHIVRVTLICAIFACIATADDARRPDPQAFQNVDLGSGRQVQFERMFSSLNTPAEQAPGVCRWISTRLKRPGSMPKCNRTISILAGDEEPPPPPPPGIFSHPLGIVTDSAGRVLVADAKANGVYILDLQAKKYSVITADPRTELKSPTGIAVDAEDNIYVTDSEVGVVFIYDRLGRQVHIIGKVHGENYYESPTGIAIDHRSGNIYLADTRRHMVFILDRQGRVLKQLGKRGGGKGPGEFRFPTAVALDGQELLVLDGRNRRIQIFDLQGNFQREIAVPGIAAFRERPVSMGIDSASDIFLFDGVRVRVLGHDGHIITSFGSTGTSAGQFQSLANIWIDSNDRIYVSDASNARVQIFRIVGPVKIGRSAE